MGIIRDLLKKLLDKIVQDVEVKRRTTREEYEELRNKYLSMGITLEDLFYYFETGPITKEKKKEIKKLIKEHGFINVY